jgi:photosynthetic reaction center cytochrome c subunit
MPGKSVLALAMLTAVAVAQTNPSAPAAKAKLAGEFFKNVQVLKEVPVDQFIPTMQFIGASLGVDCDFCHVERAFDKDDKREKQIARKMMLMMFAINKENFDGHREVTCNSCHRGATKPMAIPAVMSSEAKSGNDESAPVVDVGTNLPAANDLVSKYVQALGGADAINKISSRVEKGKASGFGDQPSAIELYTKAPEKRISFMHMPAGDSVTAYNGKEGWTGPAGKPGKDMRSSELDAASMDADLQFAVHIPQRFPDLKVIRDESVSGRPAYVIRGSREKFPPVELYFDRQTGLLVRMVRYAETAVGLLPTQLDYADYRDLDGVKTPYRWTISRPTGSFTIQVDQAQQNVPIDDHKFTRPSEPPQKPGN